MQQYESDLGIYNSVFNIGDLVCREEDFYLNRGKPRYYGEVKQLRGGFVFLRWQHNNSIDCVETQYLINVSNMVDRAQNLGGYTMRRASELAIKSTRIFSEGLQVYLDKFVKSRAQVLETALEAYVPGIQYVSAETVFVEESFYFLTFFRYGDIDIIIQVEPFVNLFKAIIMDTEEDFLSVDIMGSYLKDALVPEDAVEAKEKAPKKENLDSEE